MNIYSNSGLKSAHEHCSLSTLDLYSGSNQPMNNVAYYRLIYTVVQVSPWTLSLITPWFILVSSQPMYTVACYRLIYTVVSSQPINTVAHYRSIYTGLKSAHEHCSSL